MFTTVSRIAASQVPPPSPWFFEMAQVEHTISTSLPDASIPQDADDTFTTALTSIHDRSIVSTGEDVGEKRKKKKIRRKRRPARVQIDPEDIKEEAPPQTGTIFNIWYNKWAGGDREDKYLSQSNRHCYGVVIEAYDLSSSREGKMQRITRFRLYQSRSDARNAVLLSFFCPWYVVLCRSPTHHLSSLNPRYLPKRS